MIRSCICAALAADSISSADAPNLPYLQNHRVSTRRFIAPSRIDAPYVVGNACIEENRVLRNNSNCFAQACLCDVTDILAVDQDPTLAFLEVVEAIEQTQDRRFAGSRLPN